MADEPIKNNGAKPAVKFIRTYASDMEIAKKGGQPDLKPYEERESIIPLQSAETPEVSAPAPVVLKEPNEFLKRQAAVASPEVAPPAPPVLAKEMELPRSIPEPTAPIGAPTPLHTYAEDFSQHVKEEKASTFEILAAQQDTGKAVPKAAPKKSNTMLYLIGGTVLFVLGAGGAYVGYLRYQAAYAPIMPAPTISAPIFYDEQREVAGDGPALAQNIAQAAQEALTSNKVRLIYSANATTTRLGLFVAAQINAPAGITQNVVGESSMVGSVNSDGVPSPFFILSVLSYSDTFANMLAWESSILSDLRDFYPAYPAVVPLPEVPPVIATTSIAATTTPTTTSTKQKKTQPAPQKKPQPAPAPIPVPPAIVVGFVDGVVSNLDVRMYKDVAGRTVIVYGFWNPNTLIIARDGAAFTEIVRRLRTTRTQP